MCGTQVDFDLSAVTRMSRSSCGEHCYIISINESWSRFNATHLSSFVGGLFAHAFPNIHSVVDVAINKFNLAQLVSFDCMRFISLSLALPN